MSDIGGAGSGIRGDMQQVAQEAWLEFNNPGSTSAAQQDPSQAADCACKTPTQPEIDHTLMHGLQFGHLAGFSEQVTARLFESLLGPIADLMKRFAEAMPPADLPRIQPFPFPGGTVNPGQVGGSIPAPEPQIITCKPPVQDDPPVGEDPTIGDETPIEDETPIDEIGTDPEFEVAPEEIADPAKLDPKAKKLADKICEQLRTENDKGLLSSMTSLTKGVRRGTEATLDAVVKELSKRGKLDDLARELAVEGRDSSRRHLTTRFNTLAALNKAVAAHGNPETVKAWAEARTGLEKLKPTLVNDGSRAGREAKDELATALVQKNRLLLENAAADLNNSFPAANSGIKPDFAAKKLSKAVKEMADSGKLDDFFREMRGSARGKSILAALDKKIGKYGTADAKRLWNAVEKEKVGKPTIAQLPAKAAAAKAAAGKPATAKAGAAKPGGAKAAAKPATAKAAGKPSTTKAAATKLAAAKAAASKPKPAATKAAAKPSNAKAAATKLAAAKAAASKPKPAAASKPKPVAAKAAAPKPVNDHGPAHNKPAKKK